MYIPTVTVPVYQHQVCPTCGHCPTCGQRKPQGILGQGLYPNTGIAGTTTGGTIRNGFTTQINAGECNSATE